MFQEISMAKEKGCKHSVRYSTQDPEASVTNVYLSKKAGNNGIMPDQIFVAVSTDGPITVQEETAPVVAPAPAPAAQQHQPAPTQPRSQGKAK